MQEQHRSQLIWRHLRVIYNSYAIVSYLACWQFCAIRTARLSVQSSSQELQARVPTGLVSARRGFRALLHTTMPCVARLRPWNEPVESIPLPTLPYLGFHPATIDDDGLLPSLGVFLPWAIYIPRPTQLWAISLQRAYQTDESSIIIIAERE